MRVQDFISRYCKPTGVMRDGAEAVYEVFTVSPAAILSVMPSCDSTNDPEEVGLAASWEDTFREKREDNDFEADSGEGPLVFLGNEGFRVPLCIIVNGGEVEQFHNGNHRLAAAIDLGFTEVPVVFVERYDVWDDRWGVTETRGVDYPVLVPPPAKAAA